MIELARMHETRLQQGIQYICANGKEYTTAKVPRHEQQYDFVTAAFYLNYARTHDELRDMIRGIFFSTETRWNILFYYRQHL